MDVEKLKLLFRKHVEKYDMNDNDIIRKFYHSYRVMDLSLLFAKYCNFDEQEKEIAMIVGLLHDYARFEQWTNYGTYKDIDSIDHGDLALERLFDDNEIIDFCDNIDYYDEIYDAIKYHNKYSYPSYLSDYNKKFCKVIRDADKLDIFYLFSIDKELIKEDDNEISSKIKTDFFDGKLLNYVDVKNVSDALVLKLAMVFDLNFYYSFKYLYDMKLVDKIFDSIENKEKYRPYFEFVNKYIEDKIK